MKTLHIASILALSTALTFACGDDDDTTPIGTAGSSGSAQAGDNGGGDGPDAGGNGGSGQGGTSSNQAGSDSQAGATVGGAAGAGGAPVETCEFGDYGQGGEGGAAGSGGQASDGFELAGTWQELYDGEPIGTIEITSSFWNTSGIAAYDSEANVLYTQTACDDAYNPGAFSKIVYTDPADDAFYYCTAAFGLKTLAEAQASEGVADPEDLEAGCGEAGFPWSKVVR